MTTIGTVITAAGNAASLLDAHHASAGQAAGQAAGQFLPPPPPGTAQAADGKAGAESVQAAG